MKKKMLFLAPLFLFGAQQMKINKIDFIGLSHLSKISALNSSLLQKGDKLNIAKVDQTIKNYYSYGYFKDIIANFDNGILSYKFIEKPSILQIKYNHISDDVKKLLKTRIQRGMILSKAKLEEIKNFIVGYYDAKGEFNTVVVFDKKYVGNGVILTINVNKGKYIIINKLKFYGVKKESPSDIKSDMIDVNKDILGWLPFRNNGELKLNGLLQDPYTIRNFYLSKGYLDVKVSNPLLEANFDNNKASLAYKIHEGHRYIVQNINISIDKPGIINLKKYKSDLLLLKGYYFDIRRVRKDIKLLKTAVADKGYAYAEVYPAIKKEGNKVNVTYKIITGNKVYISDVIIQGNTTTLDRVIRRNIYLTPGYPYSLTDKQDSIKALKRTGYFDSVKLKEIKVDNSHMKILVKVKEGLTGSLKAGISYNTDTKIGFDLAIAKRDVFGSGQNIKLSYSHTGVSNDYSFNLKNPRVFDSEWFLSTSIYNSKYNGYSYTSKRKGFSITSGKNFTRHTYGSLTYGYEILDLSDISSDSDLIDDRTHSTKSYIMPSIGFNNTDDFYFPQHGMLLNSSLEYAGFNGTQNFLKNMNSAKFFYSLADRFNITTILKYKIKLGFLKEYGYTPISERFNLGGSGSVRGYASGSISPKDSSGNDIGGNRMLINSVEISVPVSLKRKMWISSFVDNGRVGVDDFSISRSSYGISFDWITPVGPLNFTWAWPIHRHSDDDLRRFEFSIGTGF